MFKTYLNRVRCENLKPRVLTEPEIPSYLSHLAANGKWLTLWLPKNDDEIAKVRAQFPESKSLLEIVSVFPKTLAAELKWMAPLSMALVLVLLWVHFQSFKLALAGLIPFATAVGLTVWMALLLGTPLSFISLIGFIMLLGLSVDYAIFAIDYLRGTSTTLSQEGTATALCTAWVTTVIGFLPLLACKHPVLAHLGHTLIWGTIGTMAGAFWALPYLLKKETTKV